MFLPFVYPAVLLRRVINSLDPSEWSAFRSSTAAMLQLSQSPCLTETNKKILRQSVVFGFLQQLSLTSTTMKHMLENAKTIIYFPVLVYDKIEYGDRAKAKSTKIRKISKKK